MSSTTTPEPLTCLALNCSLEATAMMATNLAHMARLLRDHPFPPPGR